MSAFPPLPEEEAARLCANWAESSRINLSEEHSQLVTGIAGMEEQLQSFSEILHSVQTAKSVQMLSLYICVIFLFSAVVILIFVHVTQ